MSDAITDLNKNHWSMDAQYKKYKEYRKWLAGEVQTTDAMIEWYEKNILKTVKNLWDTVTEGQALDIMKALDMPEDYAFADWKDLPHEIQEQLVAYYEELNKEAE